MAAFARREGIKYSTFAGWVLKTERKAPRAKTPRFAEVRVGPMVASSPTASLEVRLADGTIARGASASELAALVRALRG